MEKNNGNYCNVFFSGLQLKSWKSRVYDRLLGEAWGLSKWVHNGDNSGYYMAYRGC